MKQKVGQGESVLSLAKKNGFFWRTIWEHGDNAELRAKRKDPSVVFADDDIFIPVKEPKEVSKPTDAEHSFKRKGEPCKIKLQLFKFGKPRSAESYVIEVKDTRIEGTTDGDGKIEHFIPGDASSGKLILRGGKEVYPLKIGYLDPLDELIGVQQRLFNLGYNCPQNGELDAATITAVKQFQAENDLEATGEIDSQIKAKLEQISK